MLAPSDLPAPATERLRLLLDARLGLLTLADRLRQQWSAHAAAVGLSPGQVSALLTLTPGEAIPMRDLAARLDYDASNLSTLVDRLEWRGVVERRPDPADRRVKCLVLTQAGEQLRAGFWRDLVQDAGPLGPLSDADLRALSAALSALSASLSAINLVRPGAGPPSAAAPALPSPHTATAGNRWHTPAAGSGYPYWFRAEHGEGRRSSPPAPGPSSRAR